MTTNTQVTPEPESSVQRLVGRAVEVRNHCDISGLYNASAPESGRVESQGKTLNGKIVSITACRPINGRTGQGWARVEYMGIYDHPIYGNVSMRNLRAPNAECTHG